jgi:hypothetical protein
MGIAQIPIASSGITVSDGNNAGWNLGEAQWEQISEYTSTSSVSTITLSSIPQTYRSLCLTISGLECVTSSTGLGLRINSDSNSNYMFGGFQGAGSTTISYQSNSNTNFRMTTYDDMGIGTIFNAVVFFPNYNATGVKFCNYVTNYNSPVGTQLRDVMQRATYRSGASQSAISTLSIYTSSGANNIKVQAMANSAVTLWGIK